MATYLVTGANRGIGYEYCHQLQVREDTAISVCRTAIKELKVLGIRVEEGIDVTSDDSVADLLARLGTTEIDALLNNAEIIRRVTLEHFDFDSIQEQFEVNALGALQHLSQVCPKRT